MVSVVIYYGGDSGFEEKNAVMDFLKGLDWSRYTVLVQEFVNQVNCSPVAVCIEKYKE